MALTTSNWMPQYGAARNKAKDALKKGTPASDIDWMELQTLAERAGVADLYSKEALIRENYVPTNDPALASSFAVGDSKGTASTFGDLDLEVDAEADALPYTQEELDAVDIEDVLSRFNLLGGDAQVAIDNLQNAVATGSITPAEEAAFTSYAQSGEWQKRIDSVTADQREQDFQDEDSGDESDRGDDGLREGRYNEFVRMLREDPYRTDIDINAIYDEDPALGDMVNSYLGSSEYLAAQRDADGRGAEVDEQADDIVDDQTDDEEVVEWNYDDNLGQFVNDNYAKFKSRVANGDNIESSVADALLSAGASVEVARAKAKDAATFIIGRVQNELDQEAEEAVEEEPEAEVEVEEDPIITEDDPIVDDPIVDDPIVDDPVVVVDVAGNEVVPVNDAQADMDESVNEILRLIDGVDFSDVTQIEEVRGTIEGVFKDYGVALDGILSIEGASNVIDKYIDDILVQSLEQSTDLFQDTDSEETFGRKAEAGIEISMERIIDNLAIDEKEILDKTSTLIDQKYDDALERLGRLGLLEGGGIGASGANIRQATELESARATELIQAELEVGEKYRAELRETLQLFENIKTSRASEAIEEQRVRIDTTQQLLDFVVSLEEIRLGGRAQDVSEDRLLLEERSLDIEDFRARSDERLREAELTGLLDDEETLAMREVMSRIELDKRRLDLEAKIADRELSIQEKAQALNDLVQIRSLNLEAKKFNLEEALGLGGLDLQDRRMALDEIMGKAGMSIEERKLALDTLLGEGELAIRADLAAAEIEQVSISNYLAQQADRRAEIELKLQEGEINNRMALDLRRLDLETFISSNDIELRTRGLDIQETDLTQRAAETAEEFAIRREELTQRAGETAEEFAIRREELTQRAAETDEEFALRREQLAQEGKLGFARLEQEGQRISIEERRVLLDEMIEVGRLNLATQQLAFEELMSNKEYDLAERKYYTDELLAKRGLDQRDREILTNEMLANSKISIDEARLEYEKLSDEKRLALEERGIVLREDMTEAEIQVLNRNMQLSEERLELEKTSMANTEAARAFEQSMALADRTGFYIDVNGDMIPTMASRTSEREFELRQQGLDLEADRIRISSDQFNESLKQQISEFAATHNLNLRETEALIAKTEADIAAQSAMLEQDIAQADEENKINWESLRLRGIEIEVGKDATEEEMAFRREQLQLQIEQQNLDRANDAQKFADSLDLSIREFESAQDRWETEWLFSTEQAAKEFGLKEEEFAMLKWQIEQDVQLRNKSLDEASAQWAAEFGLDEEQVQQAMEFANATFNERVRAIGLENDMTEAQSDALVAELEKFNKEEQRRDVLWEDVLEGNIDWDNEDDVKEFAAHMALLNGTGIGNTGGGLFSPEPGIIESVTSYGMEWLIKEYGEETANEVRSLLGDGFNFVFGNSGDDGGDEENGWFDEEGNLRDWASGEIIREAATFGPQPNPNPDENGIGLEELSTATFATKYLGVAEGYVFDPTKSYVQNVLTGNPKTAALGAKIAPFLGPVAMALGTALAAYKAWRFFSGTQTEEWKQKSISLPVGYGQNFLPPQEDVDGGKGYSRQAGTIMSTVNWETGNVEYLIAGQKKTFHEEPIEEFQERTGRSFIPTELLSAEAGGGGEGFQSILKSLYYNSSNVGPGGYDISAQLGGKGNLASQFAEAGWTGWSPDEMAELFGGSLEAFSSRSQSAPMEPLDIVDVKYDDLPQSEKDILDNMALAWSLGMKASDVVALGLDQGNSLPDTMVIDDEGYLLFDQQFDSTDMHYVERDVKNLPSVLEYEESENAAS